MKRRRAFDILAMACVATVLVTLDVGWRDGQVTLWLKGYQLLLLIPPAVWVFMDNKRRMEKQLRAERRPAGLCAACGYDVGASAERSPECGERLEKPAGEATGEVRE